MSTKKSGGEPRGGALDLITKSGKNPVTIYGEVPPLYSIKQYNQSIYYVVKFKRYFGTVGKRPKKEEQDNDTKLDNSFSRARTMVKEYGLCNPWDWFVTLTLDKEKYNRDDLDVFHNDLQQWIRNERKEIRKKYPEHDKKLSVLLVPENHKDGAWHMHGLLYGLPEQEITKFQRGRHPYKLIKGGFMNWPRYAKKFGFCSLGRIRDHFSTVLYTTKYITKTVEALAERKGKSLYFRSNPLKSAVTVGHAYIHKPSLDAFLTYHGDFCSTGMATGQDWTFLMDDDIEVVVNNHLEIDYSYSDSDNYRMPPQVLKPAADFDPRLIDPTYEQVSFF